MTADDFQPNLRPRPKPVDPQLLALVELANHDVSFGVTLFLPWGIATGHTVSGPQFAEDLAEDMQSGAPDEIADLINTFSEKIGELAVVEAGLQDSIHLRNVTCSVGGRRFDRARLRISLADISAWDFGKTNDQGLGYPDLSHLAQR